MHDRDEVPDDQDARADRSAIIDRAGSDDHVDRRAITERAGTDDHVDHEPHATHETYIERLTIRLHARDEAEARRRASTIAERLGHRLATKPPASSLGLVTLRIHDDADASAKEPR